MHVYVYASSVFVNMYVVCLCCVYMWMCVLVCEYVCTSGYVYVVSVVMCQCLCAGSKGYVLRIHVERVSAASHFGLNGGWQHPVWAPALLLQMALLPCCPVTRAQESCNYKTKRNYIGHSWAACFCCLGRVGQDLRFETSWL